MDEQVQVPVPAADGPVPAAETDDGRCVVCGGARSTTTNRCPKCARAGRPVNRLQTLPEPLSMAGQGPLYRVTCMSCARSSETRAPRTKVGRCESCGGTLIVEHALA